MKKNISHLSFHSFHQAFASLEILLSVIVVGIGFALFWKIYLLSSPFKSHTPNPNELFSLQKSLTQKILSQNVLYASKPFSLCSQKGFCYQGKWIQETSKEGLEFHYFYPESVQKDASF